MSQWAEIRHLHLVERVPKKEIARRLKLDVKTVRRAISRSTPPVRVSPPRPGTLDPWRERIRQWLREEPRLTAKRIRRLLLPMAGPLPARTVRRYVAGLRTATTRKEAFVHRSVLPGTTMEVDFGESWVDIAGAPCKVKYLVATLPFSNAYFAKAYPVERIESLLDGIESAFRYFGGLVDRLVMDNTSLAVKDVLAGRDRVQTEAFDAFRGGYPFRAEFSAPAKGWEKFQASYYAPSCTCDTSFGCCRRSRNRFPGWAAGSGPVGGSKSNVPLSSARTARSTPWRAKRLAVAGCTSSSSAICGAVSQPAAVRCSA